MTTVKPIVHYSAVLFPPIVNSNAVIVPCDHPSPYVTNNKPATTSKVVAVNANGEFETLNTIYQRKIIAAA